MFAVLKNFNRLEKGIFLARENRFCLRVRFKEQEIRIYTNNTGSMLGLLEKGNRLWFSKSSNSKRKLPYTLELIEVGKVLVGVNTALPNQILKVVWEKGIVKKWQHTFFYAEKKINKSRLDAYLEGENKKIWIEAKNVTLVKNNIAYFPDAKTTRGVKHLKELIELKSRGFLAYCFYLIPREDAQAFCPAKFIDPIYAYWLEQAVKKGVKVLALRLKVKEDRFILDRFVPLSLKGL